MKFLTRISHNYLLPLAAVLLAVIFAGYFILRIVIISGAKEKLLAKEEMVEHQIKSTSEIPILRPLIEVQATSVDPNIRPSFRTITLKNESEDEDEEYMEYSTAFYNSGAWYIVKLRQSTFENEDLITILALTLFVLVASMLIISFLSTRSMNRKIWSGFERNLREIENYSLSLSRDIMLEETTIDEFERLNSVITGLTRKLRTDYLVLKEFTENASHEIQTPLSIALMNLEEILQNDIREDIFKKVVAVINSLNRLNSLNQSLILLAKIENKQFDSGSEVSLNELISKKTEEFAVFFEAKKLHVEIIAEGVFKVRINEYLSDILLGNLLSNSVNHNIPGGSVRIMIKPDELTICNTGLENSLTNETVFNRFTRGNPKSTGLGLAIARQICETHNLHIQYMKSIDSHCFIIRTKQHA